MINSIRWLDKTHDEFSSPFMRGEKERPLRLTFHTSALGDLSPADAESLEVLYELSHLPEIEALQTGQGDFSHIEIGEFDVNAEYVPVSIKRKDGITSTGIWFPKQWLNISKQLLEVATSGSLEVDTTLEDILVARAHCQCNQDILITDSVRLLKNRFHNFLRDANPCTPSEAISIVGLYLRLRGNYTLMKTEKAHITTNRSQFYWTLAREKLHDMSRYIHFCSHSKKIRNDDIDDMAFSVPIRCARALEALDSIAEQFYISATYDSKDKMLYHFDYLTLLLSGALDAQARIAYRVYKIAEPKSERYSSFRRKDFRESLKSCGAQKLSQLVSDNYVDDLMTLLYELRNTIHAAALPIPQDQSEQHPEISFLTIPNNQSTLANRIWECAGKCGSTDEWGLTRREYTLMQQGKEPEARNDVLLEPYTYASTLVSKIFDVINKIAVATEVERLFPENYPVPELKPLSFEKIEEISRKRIVLLGQRLPYAPRH